MKSLILADFSQLFKVVFMYLYYHHYAELINCIVIALCIIPEPMVWFAVSYSTSDNTILQWKKTFISCKEQKVNIFIHKFNFLSYYKMNVSSNILIPCCTIYQWILKFTTVQSDPFLH